MPSKNPEVLKKASKKHWEKIKDDPEVKRKAKERAKAWAEANKEKVKAYREANKEKAKEELKKWKEANKEKVKEHRAKSQRKNMDSLKIRMKKYIGTEKGRIIARSIRDAYRSRLKIQSMNMYDREAILTIYKQCKKIKEITGELYEVDHIVPLKGESVSGLHVSWNLRVISMEQNRKKSNKFDSIKTIN